jgi:hypothetical protein
VFAVHLWARSWCNTSSSSAASSAASSDTRCTKVVGMLKASDVEMTPTRRIGEDEEAAWASSIPAAPAAPATASRGPRGVDLSNSDMVWLANLATRNLKVCCPSVTKAEI